MKEPDNSPTYLDGRDVHGMSGTVIPRATQKGGKDSSGFRFDTEAPIQQNIVDGDVIKPLTLDKLAQMRKANYSPTGLRTESTLSFEELLKDVAPISEPANSSFSLAGDGKTPAPVPPTPVKGEVNMAEVISIPPATSAPEEALAKPAPRTKVRFTSSMGKLSVPYDTVFKAEGQTAPLLVLVQRSLDGIFYEPPYTGEERMEVRYNDEVLQCLSGVYFVFPDGKTALTVMLIDEPVPEEEGDAEEQ